MPDPQRIAVLVSGGGSNLEAILEAQKAGRLSHGRVVLVISSRAGVKALERAKKFDIETRVAEKQEDLLKALRDARIQVVCLAGYLKHLSNEVVAAYRGRILNIHPALLPQYGGAGMYGHFVHEAVVKAGEKESGCSVHVVDEEFDHGPVIAQTRVPVMPGDTAETLAARILVEEHKLYPKVIEEFCKKMVNHD